MESLEKFINNKKKGFTLIELLTVIVILGILALITSPIIANIISDARKNTFKNSAYGIVQAANQYYLNSKLTGESFEELTFTVNDNKLMSENKELSFSGKSPIGDSYVKINSVGEIAMNITDGTYYATKEYDETGVSITGEEENALTREELAQKINVLESELNNLKTTVETNSSSIGTNTSLINNNSSAITTLSDASNSSSLYQKMYPVGSKYITKTNENPSSYLGGTWTLVDKNLKASSGQVNDDTKYFTPTSNISAFTLSYVMSDHSYFVRLDFTSAVDFADTTLELGTINYSSLGISRFSYSHTRIAAGTDGGNGFAMINLNAGDGLISTVDIVNKSGATSIASGNGYSVVFSGNIAKNWLLDEYCDEFIWERTA